MSSIYTGRRGELNFEDDIVEELVKAGWKDGILKGCTVKQHGKYDENKINSLEGNLRKIICENNKKELNNVPLSDTEFSQIMYQIENANTPVKANILINGKHLSFTRDSDSPDKDHAGKSIYVNIFTQAQIASGCSRYQIARQTKYETSSYVNDRRGDITLLINGLPVIHLELKAQNVDVQDACLQIKKYVKEGVFTGLMGLVQVFFAINPDESVYFANFGDWQKYNESFIFHWANEKSEVINNWRTLINGGKYAMLSIPEAHQLVGYYTVADRNKDVLKVMRSYQYYAVRSICARTKRQAWGTIDPLGGINWCTTGGGKTMSSFKAGQMIRDLGLADKVVFVVDRTELNNQSLEDYNSFSREGEEVMETTSSIDLFNKLKSNDSKDALIVTSIQKMNRIRDDAIKLKQADLDKIKAKRVVYIIDEAQRSQFGEMHERVKKTFPTALFFGFTGTPIMGKSEEDMHDSRSIFGDYISTYTIASGIRDGNVLGFDPKAVRTYEDDKLREAVALQQCNATTPPDPKSEKYGTYRKFKNDIPMSSTYKDRDGNIAKGIEGYLPAKQYDNPEHRQAVVNYILDNWNIFSIGQNGTRFHALLSTTSIPEAVEYYRIFKRENASGRCNLNVTALFDSNIDNTGGYTLDKENAIAEILQDYNDKFDTSFDRKVDPGLKEFKKDIMLRLAHKKGKHGCPDYTNIGKDESKVIDILIVVDQLLTGYDSQYINTLFLDKVIESSNLIQAISRTNRVYNKEEKPFGIFRFFRKIYTMQDNLEEALRLYCEGETVGVKVDDTETNILEMNKIFEFIKRLFEKDGIKNFVMLPKSDADCQEFKKLFSNLKSRLNAVRLQGGLAVKKTGPISIEWDCTSDNGKKLDFNSDTYNNLQMRYADLIHRISKGTASTPGLGFALETTTSEIEMAKIDSDYIESHFKEIVPKLIDWDVDVKTKDEIIEEFKMDFGKLSSRQQKYASQVLEDIKNGVLDVVPSKKFIDYISEYMERTVNNAIHEFADKFGLNEQLLTDIIKSKPTENTYNEGRRCSALAESCDIEKTMDYFKASQGKSRVELGKSIKKFILEDIKNF